MQKISNTIFIFISWFGWLSYIFGILCYVIFVIFVGILVLLMPVIAYITFSFTSVMSRLVLGGIAMGDTRPDYHRGFELTPGDSMGYSLATGVTSIARFLFGLVLLLPLKLLISRHTGMSLETSISELPSYVIESISCVRPPHQFSFYCGIASITLMAINYFG